MKHRPFQRLVYPGIVDEINALLFMEKKTFQKSSTNGLSGILKKGDHLVKRDDPSWMSRGFSSTFGCFLILVTSMFLVTENTFKKVCLFFELVVTHLLNFCLCFDCRWTCCCCSLFVVCYLFGDIRFLRTMVLFNSLLCSVASLFHFAPSKKNGLPKMNWDVPTKISKWLGWMGYNPCFSWGIPWGL